MQRDLVNAGLSTQALIGLQHNFDVEILTKERPPTLCACVALGPILIMECELGWLPTFCADVVLGPIWIMKF